MNNFKLLLLKKPSGKLKHEVRYFDKYRTFYSWYNPNWIAILIRVLLLTPSSRILPHHKCLRHYTHLRQMLSNANTAQKYQSRGFTYDERSAVWVADWYPD
jgi:hypothetical protein